MSDDPQKDPGEQTELQMIRHLLGAGESIEDIERRVWEVLAAEDRERHARQSIRWNIRLEVRSAAREAAFGTKSRMSTVGALREAERTEFIAKSIAWCSEVQDPGERISRRSALLAEGFSIPQEGRVVIWGEATEKDHTARADWLEKIGYATFETAHLHRRAVSEIQAAGVKTLNEIVELRHANERVIEAPKVRKSRAAV